MGVSFGVFLVWFYGAYIIAYPTGFYVYLIVIGGFIVPLMLTKGMEYFGFCVLGAFFISSLHGCSDVLRSGLNMNTPDGIALFIEIASNRLWCTCIGAIIALVFNFILLPQRSNRKYFNTLADITKKSADLCLLVLQDTKEEDFVKIHALVEEMLQAKLAITDLAVGVENEPVLWHWDSIRSGHAMKIAACVIDIVESFHLVCYSQKKLVVMKKMHIYYITQNSESLKTLGVLLNELFLKLNLYCSQALVFVNYHMCVKSNQQQPPLWDDKMVENVKLEEINELCNDMFGVLNDFDALRKQHFELDEKVFDPQISSSDAIQINAYLHAIALVVEASTRCVSLFRTLSPPP